MDIILIPFFHLLNSALNLYIWAIIVYTVLNLFISFQVVNTHQVLVQKIEHMLALVVEPALNQIRPILPSFGTFDLSPLVLIFLIYFIQGILNQILIRLL